MTDIDTRLRRKLYGAPRRKVSVSFTDRTMALIEARSRQTVFGRVASTLQRSISMKVAHVKHAGVLAGVLATLLLGGTTYAALRWQGNDGAADYGGITTLANGDTRFWVHAHDCSDEQGKQYFDIKAGSSITPAQISDMVAGTCENTDIGALFPGLQLNGTLPKGISYKQPNGYAKAMASTEINTQYYIGGGVIKHIDSTSLTLSVPGEADRTIPLEHGVAVYKEGQPQTIPSIKSGQPVLLVLKVQATFAQAQKESFIPGSVVYGIELLHHQPYDTAADGKQFTRLVPKPGLQGPTGKNNTAAAIKFWSNPQHLVEEHPLH